MTEAKWKIDVYGYKISDSTDTVTDVLDRAGLLYEFHNMSSEAPVIHAVAKMSSIDGHTETHRVYIRRGVWPIMEMKVVLFNPSRIALQTMLRYHNVNIPLTSEVS